MRSRLFPWYVGIGVIAALEAIIAYLFFSASSLCASPIPQLFVLLLVVLPVVYLGLMYLTLKSQP
jgi:hypothetical protein